MTDSAITLGVTPKPAVEISAAARTAFETYKLQKLITDAVADLKARLDSSITTTSFVCSMAQNVGPAMGAAVEASIGVPTTDFVTVSGPEKTSIVRRSQHGKLGRAVRKAMVDENMTQIFGDLLKNAVADTETMAIKCIKSALYEFLTAITADEV